MDKERKDDEKKLNEQIVKNAEEMKKIIEKPIGLPHIHTDFIREFADNIILHHGSVSIQASEIFGNLDLPSSDSSSKMDIPQDNFEKRGRAIINTAKRSKSILEILKSAKQKTGDDPDNLRSHMGRSEAAEHLEKMVKQLHCHHRKLIRLAEEIIAKRWKLSNMNAVKDGKPLKPEGGALTAEKFSDRMKRSLSRKKRKGKRKKSVKKEDIQTLYTNPMAKLRDVAKRCGSGGEGWKQDDPLITVLNKVGVDKAEKCLFQSDEAAEIPDPTRGKRKKKEPGLKGEKIKKIADFPDATKPTLEAHLGGSALTIFVSNYSKMQVGTKVSSLEGRSHVRESLLTMTVDRSTLTNDFVDVWKRRSYSVGILLIILTTLLQCTYLCGPRMGDNYVTYTMVEAISGMPWAAPTGIYALIFLGYLHGGMAVIKTAAAVEHNQTVKQYFRERIKKFYFWYGLAFYYFVVWMFRSTMWYLQSEKTDKEIHTIFHNKFYYTQLPSRLLYTQFLISCCGANGPGDYIDGPTIGWPKSCYTRANTYEEYFSEPQPVDYGCSVRFYKYTTMAMSTMGFLILVNWLLILIHPVYLYVYELFLCMRSKEPDPWLVEYNQD